MTTDLAVSPTDLDSFTQLAADVSAASPEVALRKPVAELVQATMDAAANSAHTERAYTTAVGYFLAFLDQERGEYAPAAWRPFAQLIEDGKKATWDFSAAPAAILRLVDAAMLDAFRAWRTDQGDSANTATLRLYAVRTFLAVALRDHVLTRDQAQNLALEPYKARQKHDKKTVGRRLSPKEVRKLRRTPDLATNKGKRDLAILDLMLYAGLRRSEVSHLDARSLRQDQGRWWIVLRGKGDKTRRVKVHDELYRSLMDWLDAAEIAWHDERPLFVAVNKGDRIKSESQINGSVVTRLVGEYAAKANLAPPAGEHVLSPHDLRRTCARNAYDNGAPLLKIQQMLGHADPNTTAGYIGADFDDADTATDYVRY